MKRMIATVLLATLSTQAFGLAKIEGTIGDCTDKRAYKILESGLIKTDIHNYKYEERSHISEDKLEISEIYNYVYEDKAESGGVAKISIMNLSENEQKITVIDESESVIDGKVDKNSIATESVWRILEKTDKKEVALRTSFKVDGEVVNKKILRTKTFITKDEYVQDKIILNPLDSKTEYRQLLFQIESCHIKRN